MEEFRRSGNAVDAANKAIREALAESKSQKAARAKSSTKSRAPAQGSNATTERANAMDAIAKGAPRAAVAKMFREKTGQAL